jgi:hypothetical protein
VADALSKLARQHTEAALNALAEIARTGVSEVARVAAAKALLDCAYGKRRQAHELGGPNEHLGGFVDREVTGKESGAIVQFDSVDADA